jgi:hypothetical protein
MIFRSKPYEIEAHQWLKNGDHPLDYSRDHEGLENGELRTFTAAERKEKGWEGDIVRYYRVPEISGESVCQACGHTMHEHGYIEAQVIGYTVCPGDWIFKDGNQYKPTSPAMLMQFYELVPEA